jgi:transposase
MKRTAKYVGLDVHQATTVAAVCEESGRVIARSKFPTEATALTEFVRGMRGPVQVAFEEGTQAQWLHDLLHPLVERVVVCDRRGTSSQGHKADQADADQLAELLRRNALRSVYHGSAHLTTLKELARAYQNLVEDSTRVMQRLKAVFRARAILTPGSALYRPDRRAEWLGRLPNEPGVRLRAQTLFAELELLLALRPTAKAAMIAAARRDPAWPVLRTIPFFGPVRVAQLLAKLQTPWRFRTKRRLWAYAGFAVVTRTSAEYGVQDQRIVRRRRAPFTRGLNRNHSPLVKEIFKSAAKAAAARPGALQDWYQRRIASGMREELARVTLARKLAALTLHLWKTGVPYDPTKLTVQAR